jgi:hypothetical protein
VELRKVTGFSSHRVQTVVLVRVMVLVRVTGMVKVEVPSVTVDEVTGQVVVTMVIVLVVGPGFTGVWEGLVLVEWAVVDVVHGVVVCLVLVEWVVVDVVHGVVVGLVLVEWVEWVEWVEVAVVDVVQGVDHEEWPPSTGTHSPTAEEGWM